MAEDTNEERNLNQEIRKFNIGQVKAEQKGRVTRLQHPDFGTTYLIDITERDDPTAEQDVATLMEKTRANPKFDNSYAANNGVIALITDQLDKDGKTRVYIGVETVSIEDEEGKEITSHVLEAAGYKPETFYVPLSFDSASVRQNMVREIAEALQDSQETSLFGDAQSFLKLPSS